MPQPPVHRLVPCSPVTEELLVISAEPAGFVGQGVSYLLRHIDTLYAAPFRFEEEDILFSHGILRTGPEVLTEPEITQLRGPERYLR